MTYSQKANPNATNSELQDEIKYSFDEEVLDELVDNVTNETFIDVNNNGGKY